MPNEALKSLAGVISSVVQSIIQKTRPSSTPVEKMHREHFTLFLENAAHFHVLTSLEVCIGLNYIEAIFKEIEQKRKEPDAPTWLKEYETDTHFHAADELLCVMGMMLAHKGSLGEDIPYNNEAFVHLYTMGLDKNHPYACPRRPSSSETVKKDDIQQIKLCYLRYPAPSIALKKALRHLSVSGLSVEEATQFVKDIFRVQKCLIEFNKIERNVLRLLHYYLPDNPTVINDYARLIFIPEPAPSNNTLGAALSFQKFVSFVKISFPIQLHPDPKTVEDLLPAQFAEIVYPPIEPKTDPILEHIQKTQANIEMLSSAERRALVIAERDSFTSEQKQMMENEFNNREPLFGYPMRSPVDDYSATRKPILNALERVLHQKIELIKAKERHEAWSPT